MVINFRFYIISQARIYILIIKKIQYPLHYRTARRKKRLANARNLIENVVRIADTMDRKHFPVTNSNSIRGLKILPSRHCQSSDNWELNFPIYISPQLTLFTQTLHACYPDTMMLGPPAQNEIQGKSRSIIRQDFYDFVQILENWKVIADPYTCKKKQGES